MKPALFAAIADLLLACSPAASPSQVKIVNGQAAATTSPVTASTVAVYIDKKIGSEMCSATIVGPRQVITAAHCVGGEPASVVTVVFGLDANAEAAETRNAVGLASHPDFASQLSSVSDDYGVSASPGPEASTAASLPLGDLAAVVLDRDIPSQYKPVAIAAPEEVTASNALTLAGYGITGDNKDDAGTLRTVGSAFGQACSGPGIDGSGAAAACGAREFMLAQTAGSSCSGDSGGPAYITDATTGALKVIGADSRSPSTCSDPETYTFVSMYRGWLSCTFTALGQPLAGLPSDDSSADCPSP